MSQQSARFPVRRVSRSVANDSHRTSAEQTFGQRTDIAPETAPLPMTPGHATCFWYQADPGGEQGRVGASGCAGVAAIAPMPGVVIEAEILVDQQLGRVHNLPRVE